MKLSLIVATIALVGCTINVPPNPDPQPSPSGTGTGVGKPPVQQQRLDCGETVTQCNCGQTQAYPGAVEQTNKCESGYQFYLSLIHI